MTKNTSFIVFSGGTACNHILRAFHESTDDVSYVLGVSDNGGSTSELLRVFGGPSIGDIRSRLLRLMDTSTPCSVERTAIKDLLSYRLPSDLPNPIAKNEWTQIVEGRHKLWHSIPTEKKETIRGFLTLFNFEILKRAQRQFNFCNGSIGNFFLTSARLFLGSLEAAIFLLSAIAGIASEKASVVPVINTDHTVTIAALLENGDTLVGQCEISHPSSYCPTETNPGPRKKKSRTNPIDAFSCFFEEKAEDMYSHKINSSNSDIPANTNTNLLFSKHTEKLHSPIERIFYMNEYGQEIYPLPNPKVLVQLSIKKTLVYSIGSLFTSILPCLVLRGVGNAIVQSTSLKHKILLLNGSNDRETSDYTALNFITAITNSLNQSKRIDARRAFYQSCDDDFVPTEITPGRLPYSNSRNGSTRGSVCSMSSSVSSSTASSLGLGAANANPRACSPQPTPSSTEEATEYPPFPSHLFYPSPPSAFITHIIYLDNSTIPVDTTAIQSLGIQTVCLQGALSAAGDPIYDEVAVSHLIQHIVHT
ncbi:hypothetical protein BDF14DRAFT_1854013 [Spinellus fusiger]|nr:hypothetical protein BDF14DRAFT_1854013 [Spinellus fusiger]